MESNKQKLLEKLKSEGVKGVPEEDIIEPPGRIQAKPK